jgi:hypothetical protein
MTRKGAELPGEVIFGSDDENLFLFAGGDCPRIELSLFRAPVISSGLSSLDHFRWFISFDHFRLIINPINAPAVKPTANVAATVSAGCRWMR